AAERRPGRGERRRRVRAVRRGPRHLPLLGVELRGHDLMSIAIEVDSLSKKYRLGEYQAAYGTLRETLVHAGRRIARKEHHRPASEVGTGFNQELTGRENVYLNGAILGMKRREIEQRFDDIIEFSGVERFIDTPVKRYSSGMYVRLAFAVAAHFEPEILFVDEVLSVGDA